MASTNFTLQQDYIRLSTTHQLYLRYRPRWEFLYQSYVGGDEYRRAGHLTRYQLETDGEYNQRLRITPLTNHCASVIQTYVSFLFREHPTRELGDWETDPAVQAFLRDCDYEGRGFTDFMKQVSIWSSVFGHCWIMLTKPNTGAATAQQEIDAGVRPYINLMTPLVVSDFKWRRKPTGEYELVHLKYIEEVVDKVTTLKVWTPETIETWVMYDDRSEAEQISVEANGLGVIPAVLVYNQRSIEKGIGVSDISDISDIQKMIYNMTSENEQAVRLGTHPTLVVPPTAQIGAGAGAMIQLMDGSDPGLNPYAITFGGEAVGSIHSTIAKLEEQIDKMANTGGIRATATRMMSGVALETEFQLLNARLSEKADALELAEEQIWQLFAQYQNKQWMGVVKYPDSFNIRDTGNEINQLQTAKQAATDPAVLARIDYKLLELLEVDPEDEAAESEDELGESEEAPQTPQQELAAEIADEEEDNASS